MLRALPNRVVNYFKEVRDEVEKVAWPTQKTTLLYSAFVVGICVVVAIYFGLLDWVLTLGVDALLSL